jgi:ribose/xylose/arabinose/galactoside ABC-type transport system permease subunit
MAKLSESRRTFSLTRMATSGNFRLMLLLATIIVLFVLFGTLNPIFYRSQNLMNMVSAIAVLAIASIGMSLIILSGGLDLSIGSSLAMSAACAALVIKATNSPYLGFITSIGVAMLIGAINGYAIGKAKLNTVVFTLGMMAMARSLSQVITNNSSIKIKNDIFTWLGSGYVQTRFSTIPFTLFLIILFYAFFIALFSYSAFGRRVSAIGGNPDAAKMSGIPTEGTLVVIYVLNGFLVGIASIIDVGRVASYNPYAGVGLEFNAITAVILGGATLSGGKLDLKGTLLGVIVMGIVISGLSLLNIYVYYVNVIKGSLLLVAVISNILLEKRQSQRAF